MAAAIVISCGNVQNGTGAYRATIDAIHVRATGADVSNDDGTQKRYRFRVDSPAGLVDDTTSGYSELKAPSALGEMEWHGYIFTGPGSWTVRLHDEELDTTVATQAVTVV